MKRRRTIAHALSIAIILALCHAASATELDEACDFAYTTLNTIHGAKVTRSIGTFTDDSSANNGQTHYGCTIFLVAVASRPEEVLAPASLFWPDEETQIFRGGWRRDPCCDADGPDGTNFRIVKGRTFCDVEGSWDGGEDDNPRYVPSPKYEAVVRCWSMKE